MNNLTMFDNKTVLISGGTGSFGKIVLQHFIKNTKINEIRVFSRDEEKQDRLRGEIKDNRIKFYIGDIRNYSSIDEASKGVDFIFHAAALKQVPSCEFFPMEAIQTNVIGANNIVNAAFKNKVSKTVLLSTDKAVYPINTMGMTKALMEKLMIAKARSHPTDGLICVTRYGNVMASRGSVIPLFIKQGKSNNPLTITDPNMTRFLMSLDDSLQLVLFACSNAVSGDIFIQKAPAANIYDLAVAIKELFNFNGKITNIGIRHGEKLHEVLINREEMQKAIDCGNFYRIPSDTRDLNYDQQLPPNTNTAESVTYDEYNSFNTTRLNIEEIKKTLLRLQYIQNELKTNEFIGV